MNWYDDEQAAPSAVTLKQLDELCEAIKADYDKADEIGLTLKLANAQITKREARLVSVLKEVGKTSYDTPHGKFGITYRATVKIPSTDEARDAFFGYLRDRGVFERLISVNSQTLNSWYKQELDAAKQEGRDIQVPGIGEPTIFETVSFRKAK